MDNKKILDANVAVLQSMHREQSLARIDREWDAERRKYFVRHRNGDQRPTVLHGLFSAATALGFGLLWSISVSILTSNPVSLWLHLGGSVCVLWAVVKGMRTVWLARQLATVERAYLNRRKSHIEALPNNT